jgi:hypothetical protein
MDLTTIDLPRDEARRAVVAYRRALQEGRHQQLEAEDLAIMRGYREIARGHPIISIAETIRAGGETSRLLPKLAVARADEKRVEVRRRPTGSLRFGGDLSIHPFRSVVDLPEGTLSRVGQRTKAWSNIAGQWSNAISSESIVPTIPPELRPNADLKRYWILFEAEWRSVAPKDPALLRPLGGGLYAVVATWDLTDLERAVLGMTRA